MHTLKSAFTTLLATGCILPLTAQHAHLHVNPEWEECSIQLDSSLSQTSFHQFTKEAAMVVYFRPLTGAATLEPGRVELSILQWNTGIDENSSAWNETFVHPDSAHYLIGGDFLPFPGLTLRAGIAENMDAGVYWTKNPGANYNILAGQVQYALQNDTTRNWAFAARAGFSTIYGPDDLGYDVFGVDMLASREFSFLQNHLSLTPYALGGVSLAHGHERSEVVSLKDENVLGLQGALGLEAKVWFLRLGAEYNVSVVNTFSYKLGISVQF